jgi:hypothetical protein
MEGRRGRKEQKAVFVLGRPKWRQVELREVVKLKEGGAKWKKK